MPDPDATTVIINQPIKILPGVGPKRAESLARCGIQKIGDLLNYFPYRHEDYRAISPIEKLLDGQTATICGEISDLHARKTRSRKTLVTVTVTDDSGDLDAIWFNQPWLERQFEVGQKVLFSGKFQCTTVPTISNPTFEILPDDFETKDYQGELLPIYRLTEDLSANVMRKIVKLGLDLAFDQIEEYFPEKVLQQYNLMSLKQAYAIIHAYNCPNDILSPAHIAKARRRLIIDEFFTITMGLLLKRTQSQKLPYHIKIKRTGPLVKHFIKTLPFKLTASQTDVLKEISLDMRAPRAMNRLLQGDVGSGKTIVATIAMLMAVESGYKAALMAPTEVLARQHYATFQKMLSPHGIKVYLLTGNSSVKERKALATALEGSEALIVIGTHALLHSKIKFNKLGLAVVDEQHKFGVMQRNQLRDQAEQPDMLVMTATPIPRSLALTVYGDLDVSVLKGFPKGRQAIKTYVVKEDLLSKVWQFMRLQVQKGHQGYIVYPLIDDSDKMPLKAASTMHAELCRHIFPDLKIGLIHGRIPIERKKEIMNDFTRGAIDILVSTTVIEVGIDVPNATVMVIEEAHRFGLAQLHQLRGRIGRGSAAAYCILVDNGEVEEPEIATNEPVQMELIDTNPNSRLQIMSQTNDGFIIAQEDLKLRGPGEFFGVDQTGIPDLKIADIIKDEEELSLAHHLSETLLVYRDMLTDESRLKIRNRIKQTFGENIRGVDAG